MPAYDPTLPLIIDPAIFIYSGYLGGLVDDWGTAIAVDSQRSAYITGFTYSTETSFPDHTGPDTTHNGKRDVFVAKIDTWGDLIYAGFIGGAEDDLGYGIAVDSTNHAYVVGYTQSNQDTFPVLSGPDLTYNGSRDAFIAKVRADFSGLVYAGYIGGTGDDYAYGVAVNTNNEAYVIGTTASGEALGFPVRYGPDTT